MVRDDVKLSFLGILEPPIELRAQSSRKSGDLKKERKPSYSTKPQRDFCELLLGREERPKRVGQS